MEIAVGLIIIFLLFDIRRKVEGKQGRKTPGSAIVMDTSALIDGRVVDVISSGFLAGDVIVAKRVLDELQLLADGRDAHKRERARFGLDVVSELQKLKQTKVIIDEFMVRSELPTDECILKLAKERNARLCTNDFNLNKVASVEGVKVLNMNELAHALRPKSLPGETIEVKIIQKGEGRDQGVGYLIDGTMAVVDNASRMRNKTVIATVDRMIQTKAGKMVFASYSKPKAKGRVA